MVARFVFVITVCGSEDTSLYLRTVTVAALQVFLKNLLLKKISFEMLLYAMSSH